MPVSKLFQNIKMGGAAGPQNLGVSQVVNSSPIPCRGARCVLFHLFATDAQAGAAFSFNVGNDPNGATLHSGAGVGVVPIGALVRMNAPGGVTVACCPPAGANGVLTWAQAQLSFTANAAGHTAFQVDAQVLYHGDADDVGASVNQYRAQPV